MFIVGILSWWYGAGWRLRVDTVKERLLNTMDYFSIDLLASTLFSPFRQISAGRVSGPLGVRLHAVFDGILSRFIGAGVRLTVMGVGSLVIIIHAIVGFVSIIAWAFVPLLPVVGLILFVAGWTPWSL